ncbi:Protein of unknown function [Cotesia congregata]|uniref:Endonuclease/exonuclease/phosphatase domain-containing protein n=1 Tax=Cotesia congregata TaxID=51543 RepID=A0A8J2HEK3_COTCN|nr:Protein of unknown function [Cotesia congregata]
MEGGRWTFTRGESKSVVDYGIVNARAWDEIRRMEIGYRLDSDHQPIIIELQGWRGRLSNSGRGKQEVWRWMQCWRENDVRAFEKKEEELRWEASGGEEKWKELRRGIDLCCVKRRVRKGENVDKGWFDEQCRRLKKKLRRAGRKKRYGYSTARYRDLKKRKKKRWEEKVEKELGKIKYENQAWEFTRKDWKKRDNITDAFGIEEWKEHFMEELGKREYKPGGLL